jgi:hypothetical protein
MMAARGWATSCGSRKAEVRRGQHEGLRRGVVAMEIVPVADEAQPVPSPLQGKELPLVAHKGPRQRVGLGIGRQEILPLLLVGRFLLRKLGRGRLQGEVLERDRHLAGQVEFEPVERAGQVVAGGRPPAAVLHRFVELGKVQRQVLAVAGAQPERGTLAAVRERRLLGLC